MRRKRTAQRQKVLRKKNPHTRNSLIIEDEIKTVLGVFPPIVE